MPSIGADSYNGILMSLLLLVGETKIGSLFGKILITCLKCFKTSSLPFSYRKKKCWEEVD